MKRHGRSNSNEAAKNSNQTNTNKLNKKDVINNNVESNNNVNNTLLHGEDLQGDHFQRIVKDVKLQRIRENIQKLEKETMRRMSDQLSALIDGVYGELERFEDKRDDYLFGGEVIRQKREQDRDVGKRFVSRASPLSELMEVRHLRSLYHIFIATLIVSMLSGICSDALTNGWRSVHLGVRYFPVAFKCIDRAIIIWLCMFTITCSAYPFLAIWQKGRQNFLAKTLNWLRFAWDIFWISGFLIGLVSFMLVIPFYLGRDMAPASAVFVMLEQSRFVMKIHAFVRSNVPKLIKNESMPPFLCYLYYLFAPTLIYQNVYPRTPQIRWRFIAGCFVEFFGAILMLSILYEFHIYPEFHAFGLRPQTYGTLVASISRTVLPASLFTLCGFYLFLHTWLNIWAELLRFADRRFYGAWWNATSYGEFYRTWNCVVHDYLHTYIYRDALEITRNKTAARFAVFAVSALVHEWIIACMLGFCYPVMFVQFFGVGTSLTFIRSAAGKGHAANIFLWVSLGCGLGLQYSLYSMESFARINCPKENTGFFDYFVPRSWSCNGLIDT